MKLIHVNQYGALYATQDVISLNDICIRSSYQINELPKPSFMRQTLEELSIGTFKNLVKVRPVIDNQKLGLC